MILLSLKTSVNDLYNPVLLLRRHFVVRGEAEAAAEDVCANVDAGTGDVGVGTGTTSAGSRDEGVAAIEGLQMHGLPDGAAFRVESGQGVQDLLGAALAGHGGVEIVLFAADLGCHGVLVDDHAGEPVVRLRLVGIKRIHLDR